MTKRELFMANVEGAVVTAEMAELAAELLEKMDASNEARKVKMAEKAAEKAPLREAIMACITSEPKTATMLIEESGVTLTPQSIPSLLKPLVESGVVVKTDVKVKGKGTQRGYVVA